MIQTEHIEKVSIALKPNVYNTFRNLVNTVSNTLAEYVDNAVQSYLNHKEELITIEPNFQLQVNIVIDRINDIICITDNAAGIDTVNFKRAFEPAHIPLDNTGLNQFGMGMKTASVWLADKWTVYTKALGEDVERATSFDLHKVTSEGKEELVVENSFLPLEEHYTKIILESLSSNAPSVNQLDKIKRLLSSIYRKFLRTNELQIIVNGESVKAVNYDVLNTPFYKTPDGDNILWKKEINYQSYDGKYKAKGFIAILERMQNNASGLVLMRNGRVIVGGGEERYFPSVIFGQVGSFRYRRIFGELELEGFEVTFNKNGFRDEDNLYALMEALRDELRSDNFNLLAQADNYRQRSREEYVKISKDIKKKLDKQVKPKDLTRQIQDVENKTSNKEFVKQEERKVQDAKTIDSHTEDFFYQGENYSLRMDLFTDAGVDVLYSITLDSNDCTDIFSVKQYVCKINLAHPFFTRFEQFKKSNDYMPIISIFKSFAIAEITATLSGISNVSDLRIKFNQYILQ